MRGLTLNDAVEKMRGLVNTPIKLTILREGADKPIELTIVRDIIKVKAVKFRVENDVGYMKITSFTEKTFDDLQNAIEKIKKQVPDDKLKGYVLDLRLNPGGLLDQAVSVSDAFLDRGEIVSTRGRDPKDITRFDARPGDLTDGKPLIVLVNGGSASASEIVAGALQDHRRATVLGTQSFGKGSVQTIIPLGENGALRLTTALYYTPSGKSIQGKGITPDIKVEQPLPDDLKGRDVTRGESELQGPHQGRRGERRGLGLGRLCAAGCEGRRAAQLCARPAARHQDRSGLPAESGQGRAEPAVRAEPPIDAGQPPARQSHPDVRRKLPAEFARA